MLVADKFVHVWTVVAMMVALSLLVECETLRVTLIHKACEEDTARCF